MKKVGIITFHRALNYGAVLQTYALVEKLKNMSPSTVQIEVIDYRNDEIEKNRKIKQKIKKGTIKNFIKAGYTIIKTRKFNKFILKNIQLSKLKYNKKNLDIINNEYDSVIVGSDQIWNYKITNSDYTYLLDFNLPRHKKNSYAASMGICELSDTQKSKYYEMINNFNNISVRENDCMEFLKNDLSINLVNVHLDPTLLLTSNDWRKFVTNNKKYNKYILVYNVPKTDLLYKKAYELANKTGLKIIAIPNGISPKNCKIIRPGVEEFLNLFANAEYIITNSFHGTVFSIQFHKKFMVELRKDGVGNDRINTLLNVCKLKKRVLSNNNIDSIQDNIDWNTVDNLLEIEKNKSIQYLNNIIKEVIGNEK